MTIIGINLMPVAMNYLAGGEGAKNYGDTKNLILGGVTLLIILILQKIYKGLLEINCDTYRISNRYCFSWYIWNG